VKRLTISILALLVPLFMVQSVYAQEKSQTEQTNANVSRSEGPQVRVQVVFTEYEGQKKIQSFPYALLVRATDIRQGAISMIRMGSRVPVVTGTSPTQFQYVDVGTNVDCEAITTSDGRYRLYLKVERSWPEREGSADAKSSPTSSDIRAQQPVIRQFRSDNEIVLRDGQSLETDSATDPVTGKVIKIEVSLNVVK
jgi:hypothetical protein